MINIENLPCGHNLFLNCDSTKLTCDVVIPYVMHLKSLLEQVCVHQYLKVLQWQMNFFFLFSC